jgi:hypothetical protein
VSHCHLLPLPSPAQGIYHDISQETLEEEFSGLQFTEKDERMIAEERYAPYYCCGEYIVIDFTYIGRGTRKGIGGYIKTTMR